MGDVDQELAQRWGIRIAATAITALEGVDLRGTGKAKPGQKVAVPGSDGYFSVMCLGEGHKLILFAQEKSPQTKLTLRLAQRFLKSGNILAEVMFGDRSN